jgi:hypothetical protein
VLSDAMRNHLRALHNASGNDIYSAPRSFLNLESLDSTLNTPAAKRQRKETHGDMSDSLDVEPYCSEEFEDRVCFRILMANPHLKKQVQRHVTFFRGAVREGHCDFRM